MPREEEVDVLRQQAEYFRASLEEIEKRLEALESSDA
jgi:prefoldin subunit 5